MEPLRRTIGRKRRLVSGCLSGASAIPEIPRTAALFPDRVAAAG